MGLHAVDLVVHVVAWKTSGLAYDSHVAVVSLEEQCPVIGATGFLCGVVKNDEDVSDFVVGRLGIPVLLADFWLGSPSIVFFRGGPFVFLGLFFSRVSACYFDRPRSLDTLPLTFGRYFADAVFFIIPTGICLSVGSFVIYVVAASCGASMFSGIVGASCGASMFSGIVGAYWLAPTVFAMMGVP